MYNSDLPTRAELPTARQLIRSTVVAAVAAAAILIAIVLPAEYGIDPTGIGRMLGLTEMGEIKEQLSREAEEDRRRDRENAPAPTPDRRSGLGALIAGLLVGEARAQAAPSLAQAGRKDETSFVLTPGQGIEVKLRMRKGDKANFKWTATGGEVNYDLHADGSGQSISYKKGRAVGGDEGVLTAAFDGNHGWFWRNRTKNDVTVVLQTAGDYSEIKRLD